MQKISLQKKSFFNSIGLNISNLPNELKLKASCMSKKLTNEEINFLKNENLTKPVFKHFRLKNLIGVDNEKLDNKAWIEIFANN